MKKEITIRKLISLAQYKPILTVTFDSNYIDDIKFGMSKRPKFYIENTLSLNGKMEIQFNKKRISISLYVLNIGRGEANNIKISSLILDSKEVHGILN